jgi:hypothetical protein
LDLQNMGANEVQRRVQGKALMLGWFWDLHMFFKLVVIWLIIIVLAGIAGALVDLTKRYY